MASDQAAAALNSSVFYFILLITVLLGYWIRQTKYKYATEGSVALLLGAATGGFICLLTWAKGQHGRTPHRLIEFDEDIFFQVLLPPIIFSAGFSVKKKLFFRNFVTLMIFGVVGTMFTAAALAATAYHLMQYAGLGRSHLLANALSVGTVFSCTDSVAILQLLDKDAQPLLYSLLFGEGVVNDATAIVLLGATMTMRDSRGEMDLEASALGLLLLQFLQLFVSSLLLGLAFGMASAAVIRWLFRRASPDREVLVVGLMGLMAYFVAEALELSAILAVFFCGIAMSHYTWHSLSPAAKVITRHGFHIIATLCEVVLFVYAGLDMWVTALWPSQPPVYSSKDSLAKIFILAGGLLAAMLAVRAAFTFPVCWLANRWWRKRDPIPRRGDAVIWWGGLPRGAITLALAYHCFYKDAQFQQDHKIIIAACVVLVGATIGGFGFITQPIMQALLGPAADEASTCDTTHAAATTAFAAPAAAAAAMHYHQPPAHDTEHHHHHHHPHPPEQQHANGKDHHHPHGASRLGASTSRPPLPHAVPHPDTAGAGRSMPIEVVSPQRRQAIAVSPGVAGSGSCGARTASSGPRATAAVIFRKMSMEGPGSVLPIHHSASAHASLHDDHLDVPLLLGYSSIEGEPHASSAGLAAHADITRSHEGRGVSMTPAMQRRSMSMAVLADADVDEAGIRQDLNDQLWEGNVPGLPPPQHGRGDNGLVPEVGESAAVLLGPPIEVDEERTWIHRQWRKLDAALLQPIFGGSKSDVPVTFVGDTFIGVP